MPKGTVLSQKACKSSAKSIKFSSAVKTLYEGNKASTKIAYMPSSTNPKTLHYKSSDKKIATVSSKGLIKGIRKGSAVITAKTANGKIAKCKVKVKKLREYKAKVNVKILSVRKGPGNGYKKMGHVKKGGIYKISGILNDEKWIYVKAKKGWVTKKYMKVV